VYDYTNGSVVVSREAVISTTREVPLTIHTNGSSSAGTKKAKHKKRRKRSEYYIEKAVSAQRHARGTHPNISSSTIEDLLKRRGTAGPD
jgi:hypothetical protein